MVKNIFFKQEGPFLLSDLFNKIKFEKKVKIYDIKALSSASDRDLTFYDSVPNQSEPVTHATAKRYTVAHACCHWLF